MTMKQIRDALDVMGAITSIEKLREAVPFIVAAQVRTKAANTSIREISKDLAKLADTCAAFALRHPKSFVDEIKTSPIGVKSGNMLVDGETYHLAAGFGTPKRIDGEWLTQEFLADLPKGWAKLEWRLDTTEINRKCVKADALSERGLFRPAKNEWSLSVPGSVECAE